MKQVVLKQYGGPEVLEVTNADIPTPQPGEVLLKMAAVGISKPDYLMRTGAYPWTKGILPFYPGLYGTGTVAKLGDGVAEYQVGDMVFVDHPVICGCYAEYKTAPITNITKLPAGTNLEYAAVMTNYVIAWCMLTRILGRGDGQVIYMKGAAGALGSAVVQLAPLAGYRIIASASTDEKCDYLHTIGVKEAFNYNQQDETEAVLACTDGLGADIVLDQTAGPNLPARLSMLKERGTLLVYNYLEGDKNTGILEALIAGMAKCQAVRVFSFHWGDDKPDEIKALRNEVFTMLAEGKIKPHIFAEFSIEEIQAAHGLLDSGKFTGSLILRF